MSSFEVRGGKKLQGTIIPQGAKNEALQVLCAPLLTPEKVTISNVPDIVDVNKLIDLLQTMGVKIEKIERGTYSFQAKDIDMSYLETEDFKKRAGSLRGSIMIVGPLLARFGKGFIPKPGGHAYANELVAQVHAMNQGILLHEETESLPTNFCVGVAAYPEKHFEATTLDEDLRYLKQKVDAGADYIVTQMFFNNQHYFDFVAKCRAMDIHVPIIPGLKPIATARQLEILPEIFHLEIPEALAKEVRACTTNAAIKQVGVEWAVQQGRELMQAGVPALHFYTMSKSDSVHAIASQLF